MIRSSTIRTPAIGLAILACVAGCKTTKPPEAAVEEAREVESSYARGGAAAGSGYSGSGRRHGDSRGPVGGTTSSAKPDAAVPKAVPELTTPAEAPSAATEEQADAKLKTESTADSIEESTDANIAIPPPTEAVAKPALSPTRVELPTGAGSSAASASPSAMKSPVNVPGATGRKPPERAAVEPLRLGSVLTALSGGGPGDETPAASIGKRDPASSAPANAIAEPPPIFTATGLTPRSDALTGPASVRVPMRPTMPAASSPASLQPILIRWNLAPADQSPAPDRVDYWTAQASDPRALQAPLRSVSPFSEITGTRGVESAGEVRRVALPQSSDQSGDALPRDGADSLNAMRVNIPPTADAAVQSVREREDQLEQVRASRAELRHSVFGWLLGEKKSDTPKE